MDARNAVMDAVDRTTSAFRTVDIVKSTGINEFPVSFMLSGLARRGYLTCLSRKPTLYAKSKSWGPAPDIYSAIPNGYISWYECMDFLPSSWQPVGA